MLFSSGRTEYPDTLSWHGWNSRENLDWLKPWEELDVPWRLQQLRGENDLRWAFCKWLPRRKNKAAARKKDILHRMSKSRSKTHLANFENKNWGFHVKSRIEKLLYPAILHGKSIELASGCLVSKGLVTFPALYPLFIGLRITVTHQLDAISTCST